MSNTISNINVALTASTKKFTGGMDKAGNSIQKFTKNASPTKDILGGISLKSIALGAGLATVAVGAYKAATAISDLVSASFESMDQTAKFARTLGGTIAELQGLRHAADLSGVSQDQFDASLKTMNMNLGKFAAGTGEAKNSLEELGFTANQFKGISLEQRFGMIANSIKKIKDPINRARYASEIFGEAGVSLLQTLDGGSESIAKAREEAEKLGIAYSEVDAANIEEANDAISKMGKAFTGLGNTIAANIAPIITILADGVTDLIVGFRPVVNQIMNIVSTVMKSIIAVVHGAWLIFKPVFSIISDNFRFAFEVVFDSTDNVMDAFSKVGSFIRDVMIKVVDYISSTFTKIQVYAKKSQTMFLRMIRQISAAEAFRRNQAADDLVKSRRQELEAWKKTVMEIGVVSKTERSNTNILFGIDSPTPVDRTGVPGVGGSPIETRVRGSFTGAGLETGDKTAKKQLDELKQMRELLAQNLDVVGTYR